ncbi:hypothetical protein ABMA27_009098 [Loxostege sticticalis]|uniref:Regulatory protein zeste n=1 Tax=Loxostege sticticalis TaxID=481309 RepID=A0ABR3HAA3_LOXSC
MSDRKRSPNWQLPEKILLVDLVSEHFSIVENKRTDGVTIRQKNADLAHRTAENLKAQWESLKKATKKEASATRQSMIQTGGGPAKPKTDDPLHTRILGLISTAVVGFENKYDSDSVIQHKIKEIPNEKLACVKIPDVTDILSVPDPLAIDYNTSLIVDLIEINDDKSQGDTADWGDYTPKMLQAPKSAALRSGKRISEDVERKESLILQKTWSSKRRKQKKIDLEMKIKNEILKQEKIKTQLLLVQLKRAKCFKKK